MSHPQPTATVSNLNPQTEDLADAFVTAIEAGDVDDMAAVFAPSAVSWHSYDGVEVSAAASAIALGGLFAAVLDELRYRDVRRHAIDGGFVQQHNLTMRAKTGATFSTGVCMVVRVLDGKITRVEEYLDSSVIQFGMDNAPTPTRQTVA